MIGENSIVVFDADKEFIVCFLIGCPLKFRLIDNFGMFWGALILQGLACKQRVLPISYVQVLYKLKLGSHKIGFLG